MDQAIAVVLDREGEWARSGSLDCATKIVVPNEVVQARVAATWGSNIAQIADGLAQSGSRTLFSRLLDIAAPQSSAMRIGVSTCVPDGTKAPFWGDTYLAHGLMRAFRRRGHEATELIAADWRGPRASSCDVVIHLRGLTRRPVARGQWNLLWIISHPERLEPDEYYDYDIIASASHLHAAELAERIGRPVHFIPQAVDIDRFKLGAPDPNYAAPILYVGNSRWPHRRAPRWLALRRLQFHLYGRNWERSLEGRYVCGDFIPNHELGVAYRSAAVVVADHHESMRANGFVANRIFDVLASGGVVLSDDVRGIDELFGDLVPTYSDASELEGRVRQLLADDALRRSLASRGREAVLLSHTLDHRADEWLGLLDKL
jgi:glycosyltransferase involved in cell wall biosynthesis